MEKSASNSIPTMSLATNGLAFYNCHLKLTKSSISGSVHNLTTSITIKHVFVMEKSQGDSTEIPQEAVIRLVVPDFGSATSFEAKLNNLQYDASIIDSQNEDSLLFKQAHFKNYSKGVGPNPYIVVIKNVQPNDVLELSITLLAEIAFNSSRWLLVIPTLLVPTVYIGKEGFNDHTPAKYYSYKLAQTPIQFSVDLQIKQDHQILDVSSPSHPIEFGYIQKRNQPRNSGDRFWIASVKLSSKSSAQPVLASDDFVLSWNIQKPNASQMFPMSFIEKRSEKSSAVPYKYCAMMAFQPTLPTFQSPVELLIIVDTANIPVDLLSKNVKAAIKTELTGTTNAALNVVLLTKTGPSFALPKTSFITQDILNKVYSFIDQWDTNIKKQGQRSSHPSNSLVTFLTSVLSRPSPPPVLPRNIIFVCNLHISRHTTPDQLLPILDECSVFPVGIGTNANYFGLSGLATATHGKAEIAWDLKDVGQKMGIQIQRARQPPIHDTKIDWSFDGNPNLNHEAFGEDFVVTTPDPLSFRFSDDVLYAYAFFKDTPPKSTKGNGELKAEISCDWAPNGTLTSAPFHAMMSQVNLYFEDAYVGENNAIHKLAATERIFDLEMEGIPSSDISNFANSYGILSSSTTFQHASSGFFKNGGKEGEDDRDRSENQERQLFMFTIVDEPIQEDPSLESPVPTKQRLVYDLDLLLNFQNTMDRPPDLPSIPGVTIDSNHRHHSNHNSTNHSRENSTHHSRENSGTASKPGTPKGHRKNPHQPPHSPGTPPSSGKWIKQRPSLTITGVWAEADMGDVRASKSPEYYAAWFKNINGILNKITKDNYDRLTTKLVEEVLNESDDLYALKGISGLIYDKAVRQVSYCDMYADISRLLVDKTSHKTDIVRRSMLDRCKAEFETAMTPKELLPTAATVSTTPVNPTLSTTSQSEPSVNTDSAVSTAKSDAPSNSGSPGADSTTEVPRTRPKLFANRISANQTSSGDSPLRGSGPVFQEDEEEKENRLKEMRVGLVTFMGKLYDKGMVNAAVTQSCIGELMMKGMQYQEKYLGKANELLNLASKYLKVVSVRLEQTAPDSIEQLFTYIEQEITDNPVIDSTVKYLFLDLVELRRNNWVPRQRQSSLAPQTIGDIRKSQGFKQ